MKPVIISYSDTLNNEKVAEHVARYLKIDWIKIETVKKRTMFTAFLDLLFRRKPKLTLDLQLLDGYDVIFFVGPIWLGQVATPFRRIFKYLKNKQKKYALITICGGNQEPISNPHVKTQLLKRMGNEPLFIQELKLFDLMPELPAKERDERMFKYQMNQEEIEAYATQAIGAIQPYI